MGRTLSRMVTFLLLVLLTLWMIWTGRRLLQQGTTACRQVLAVFELHNLGELVEHDWVVTNQVPQNLRSLIETNFARPARGQRPPWKDPWWTPYRMDVFQKHVRLRSAGPDRRHYTSDDLVYELELK
ncbi:MAG: hypothetical protein ACYCW6_05635 [Candidatus Xenobia bacterium]